MGLYHQLPSLDFYWAIRTERKSCGNRYINIVQILKKMGCFYNSNILMPNPCNTARSNRSPHILQSDRPRNHTIKEWNQRLSNSESKNQENSISGLYEKTSFGPTVKILGVSPLKKALSPSFLIMLLKIRNPDSGFSKFLF